jgi:hypothetical protein
VKAQIGGWLICGACLRVRFSPIHALWRALDICPGDKS